ncbi:anaphase-promoting complex subunit 13 [Silurus meridionalis]|nr:anaphase-promoting complex subunit 13 [Silurus meridionalis]
MTNYDVEQFIGVTALSSAALLMDSEVQRDGRVLDLTDDAWREDRLPYEDVTIPLSELPEAEQDNGGSTESVKEQEMKWSDLALQSLHENTPSTGT